MGRNLADKGTVPVGTTPNSVACCSDYMSYRRSRGLGDSAHAGNWDILYTGATNTTGEIS